MSHTSRVTVQLRRGERQEIHWDIKREKGQAVGGLGRKYSSWGGGGGGGVEEDGVAQQRGRSCNPKRQSDHESQPLWSNRRVFRHLDQLRLKSSNLFKIFQRGVSRMGQRCCIFG